MPLIVADLFDDMGALNNESDLSEGGSDESNGVVAVQMAIRHCYTIAAGFKSVLSTRGKNTIKTDAGIEFTNKPSDLFRTDRMWAIDLTTKQPKYEIDPIEETGGHMPTLPWPYSWTSILTSGQPTGYYQDEGAWYWRPVPDAVYEQRVYGLWLPEHVEDRQSPINLPGRAVEMLRLPLASFALKYMDIALDDPADVFSALAAETFGPALRTLQRQDRSRAQGRIYGRSHTT